MQSSRQQFLLAVLALLAAAATGFLAPAPQRTCCVVGWWWLCAYVCVRVCLAGMSMPESTQASSPTHRLHLTCKTASITDPTHHQQACRL